MNTFFVKLFLPFTMIITLIIIVLMVSFSLIYSGNYEEQIVEDNNKQAMYISRSLFAFMHGAYKVVEELSYNSDVLSMDNERQTAVFTGAILRNDHFELLYAQGMDGMQTGRSSGDLGNRKERWWFIQMEQSQKPFISQSYYSVGTNMPCASIFYPMYNGETMTGIMAGDIRLSSLHELVVEVTDEEHGTWAFILDGKGVVVAHPDRTYQDELYNYLTLTKTVTIKDETGVPIQDASGNLTQEQSFELSEGYRAAIEDMMRGSTGSVKFDDEGKIIYLSYTPVELDGYSEPWYVLSVKDGDIVLNTRNTVILLIGVSSAVIIIIAVLAILLTVRSVSSRVKTEALKTRLEIEKAQASERAKSEFLAVMSHEIRTPMNAILGITELQLQKEDMPGEYMDAFETIYSSGYNLLGIINDILDMSKIETGKLELHPTQYDIPSLINDTIQINIIRIGTKPVNLMLSVDKNLPILLYGDELRIKQILNNLLSNAIKYTDKGLVKLTVKLGDEEIQADDINNENPGALYPDLKAGSHIKLEFIVEDTGQGIKAEDKERLFTEYARFNTQQNRATEGTGLGLSITRKLAEMMGGEISVESEFGRGSAFTVKIVQRVENPEAIGEQVVASLCSFTYINRKIKERRKSPRHLMPYGKVLIVDDVHSNLYVAKGLLSQYKLNIDTAHSGIEAIHKVEDGAVYDIILMDHMMPKMDGLEATKRLRELGYDGCIIALTANALTGNDELFIKSGFDDYISKPIDVRILDSMLNKYIRDKHPEEHDENAGKDDAADGELMPVSEKLIMAFCRDAKKAAAALRRSMENGDLKAAALAAHTMKSVLANLSRDELSGKALRLENAARDGNDAYLRNNAEEFLKALEELTDEMRKQFLKSE